MLDFVRRDTSLEMKRQELAAQVAEGRTVIAALLARQAVINEKIEIAASGLRRLEQQIEAMNTVVRLFADEEVHAAHFAAPAPAPALKVVREPEAPTNPPKPQPFRPTAYLQCLVDGHTFVTSRSQSGHMTCCHCRIRRKT